MKNYDLQELIKIFGGHGWEFSNQPVYQDGDFNLPWALKCLIEEVISLKNELKEKHLHFHAMKIEIQELQEFKKYMEEDILVDVILPNYKLSSCPWEKKNDE